MAHECGHVATIPFLTYNSGFIVFKINDKCKNLIEEWERISKAIFTNKEIDLGDQHTFVYALSRINPKIFTLSNVINLRCHPVYENKDRVWSPVFAVHNHELTKWIIKGIKYAELDKSSHEININNLFSSISKYYNPIGNEYTPREVSCEKEELKKYLFREYFDITNI